MGPDAMTFIFWMLSFMPTFSLSSFTFIKRLFSSSSLSAIRLVLSAYLRLLIFLLAILIPACASSSPAFLIMYSAYKGGNAKECSNYCTIALISHASKIMLRILQARLPWYVNRGLPDVQAGFRKGRVSRNQIANIPWIIKKAREFQKNIYFCFIDYVKAFDSVDHNKL